MDLETRLEEIGARLRALGDRDSELTVFGASDHRYYWCPPLTSDEVAAFESAAGVRLPADYRAFVTHVCSGGPGPGYGLLWLGAALLQNTDDREEWHRRALAALFPDDDRKRWCDEHLSTERPALRRLPDFAPQRLRGLRQGAWAASPREDFVGDRSQGMRALLAPEHRRDLATPFPLTTALDAGPDIGQIDWGSLNSNQAQAERDRLWEAHGFAAADHGTIPLCAYGHGVTARLVVHGQEAGRVWVLDAENFLLEPYGEHHRSFSAQQSGRPYQGNDFLSWYSDWLDADWSLRSSS